MVPWWKRLIYSLASTLIASIACGLMFEFQRLLDRDAHFQASDPLWFVFTVLVFTLPGWLLAMPFVLLATDFHGWRWWLFVAVGSAIGPIFMIGLAIYERLTPPHDDWLWGNGIFFGLATAVSCVTTLIYVGLIRRAQRVWNSN
jgi:hypothetical protein